MEIHPSDQPVDDPFWAAVRRRHPDVDVVLLPSDPPPADPDGPVLDEGQVAEAIDRVAAVAAELTAGLLSPERRVDRRLRPGPLPGTVEPTVRTVDRSFGGHAVLLTLGTRLESAGWELRRLPGAAVERLAGRRDHLAVDASYAAQTGALVVTVSAGPLRVADRETARRLVRLERERG